MKNIITQVEKNRIDSMCKDYKIEKYHINSDGTIDVDGDVILMSMKLTKLDIDFNKVSGDFICHDNKLTTLKGSPRFIGGSFDCSYNKLSNLDYCPLEVNKHINCGYNYLTSLIGLPLKINENLIITENNIPNLIGIPEYIGGNFVMRENLYVNSTYSNVTDIDIVGDIIIDDTNLPKAFLNNKKHWHTILKYQRHFSIWNDDLSFNQENFEILITEIEEGLK